jgi:hypothetical protein
LVRDFATPRAVKIDTADLEKRVERLELEAREFEARARIIEARAHLEKLKSEHGMPGKRGPN